MSRLPVSMHRKGGNMRIHSLTLTTNGCQSRRRNSNVFSAEAALLVLGSAAVAAAGAAVTGAQALVLTVRKHGCAAGGGCAS